MVLFLELGNWLRESVKDCKIQKKSYYYNMSNILIKNALKKLRGCPLKMTAQRISLIEILYIGGNAHFTAEQVYRIVQKKNLKISLATVYNCLKQFTKFGILKEIRVSPDKMYFDTNNSKHHHFYYKDSGKLEDVAINKVKIDSLPVIPKGQKLESIEVLINLKNY